MGKRNRVIKNWLIGLLVALNLGLGLRVVMDYQDKRALAVQNTLTRNELLAAYQHIDSIQVEIKFKIDAIAQLGGEIDTLLQVQNTLKSEKKALDKRTRKEIQRLQARLEGYRELLVAKDEEIQHLKDVNQGLLTENTDLKTTQNKLKSSLKSLNATHQVLEEKVVLASKLEVENISVGGINSRGKDLRSLSANRVHLLRVEFDIKPNPIAAADGKEVIMRIIDPNNRVLFDLKRVRGKFGLAKSE